MAALKEVFWDCVPRSFMERLLRGVFEAYADAYAKCRAEHAEPEAINLEPFKRRNH